MTDELFQSLPSHGWLTRGEADLLWRAASGAVGPILECGVYHGRSTCLLAALSRPMYCVDPFKNFDSDDMAGDKAMAAWATNIQSRGIDNARLFIMDIADWPAQQVGFAYLDGDHTYEGTLVQIRKALECRATTIAVHDVNDSGGGLDIKRACLEMLGELNERVERLAVWQIAYGFGHLAKLIGDWKEGGE